MTTAPVLVPRRQVWTPPGGAFWAGVWQPVGRPLEVRDPEDGALVGVVTDSTAADVAVAVDHLAARWDRVAWPLWARRAALEETATRLTDLTETFVNLISTEGCKTIAEARTEVARAVETLHTSARATAELEGATVPFQDTRRGAGWTGWYSREPVGLVAAITPFNDPLNLVAHKLGPALIAGNGVILKPAQSTPLTALALVQILVESGVPGERLAVLAGHQAGPALVADPRIDVVSFTGGPATADRIAAGGRARRLLMELGGNNALIACADADPARVADAIVGGAFGTAGQSCLSVQRAFVADAIFPEVLERVVSGARRVVAGSKRDPHSDIGPLITTAEAVRVQAWVVEAVAGGAVVRTGGTRSGAFVTPTVLTDVPVDARIRREEVFGPIVMLEPFDTLADAIDSANAVDTGLQAGVFTRDIDTALTVARRLRVGAVMINESSDFRIDAMPFGGFKRSGIGREGIAEMIRELTEPKIVAIRAPAPDQES
ncbi:aldehyde dehydrogenase family protein [Occultella glacieicola]|uniref:Aldehyde dehydrogenase family protein n=1 Tax=Occultella glacieicola TaxID=2518684 RepID=A0ABY2DX82_9MICO|nr:aldehyde dehydrogenase family protein [Occultella glacieicola]TDE88554.1 aldehyde dehydrogenase family protein [Occultella glacieicola]